jgi:hypothetical protein
LYEQEKWQHAIRHSLSLFGSGGAFFSFDPFSPGQKRRASPFARWPAALRPPQGQNRHQNEIRTRSSKRGGAPSFFACLAEFSAADEGHVPSALCLQATKAAATRRHV